MTVPAEPITPLGVEEETKLKELGITRVSVDYFFVGEFRYARLEDAVAQAKRSGKPRLPER